MGGTGGSRLKGSSTAGGSGGGKFVEGGLANQVLGWTLETLSLGGSGGIFGYAGGGSSSIGSSGRGELEGWRRVRVLGVAGGWGEEIARKGGLEGNLALGGVLVSGEETYGSRTEERRYLLVTGRGAGGMNSRGLERLGKEGGEVMYTNPWWDVTLGGGGEGKEEGEEGYRVLCAWDVGSGSVGERREE